MNWIKYIYAAAKDEISKVLNEALENKIISREEFEGMTPTDKNPGRYYELFKVHKEHQEGSAPPERPIISGSGSITEGISKFVQHHIKDLSMQHPAYLQDTPHLLRDLNDLDDIPEDAIIASCDETARLTASRARTSGSLTLRSAGR